MAKCRSTSTSFCTTTGKSLQSQSNVERHKHSICRKAVAFQASAKATAGAFERRARNETKLSHVAINFMISLDGGRCFPKTHHKTRIQPTTLANIKQIYAERREKLCDQSGLKSPLTSTVSARRACVASKRTKTKTDKLKIAPRDSTWRIIFLSPRATGGEELLSTLSDAKGCWCGYAFQLQTIHSTLHVKLITAHETDHSKSSYCEITIVDC